MARYKKDTITGDTLGYAMPAPETVRTDKKPNLSTAKLNVPGYAMPGPLLYSKGIPGQLLNGLVGR